MPLRKNHPIIPLAVLAFAGAAVVPATADAGILSFLTPAKTTTTGKATPTPTPAPAKATPTPAPAKATTTTTTTTAAVTAPSTTSNGSTTCSVLPTTKAFQGVDGDTADYSVAPGGTFENGATGWTLTGSAAVATGNETLGIASGSKSLRLPLGATATSPEFCVDDTNPNFRFAYKVDNVGAAGFAAYVIYRDAAGAVTKTQLVSSTALSLTPTAWQASPKSPLATIIPLTAAGKSASVQLKFVSTSPADLGGDVATAVVGTNALGGLISGATSLGTSAINIGTGVASNVVNVGVTIELGRGRPLPSRLRRESAARGGRPEQPTAYQQKTIGPGAWGCIGPAFLRTFIVYTRAPRWTGTLEYQCREANILPSTVPPTCATPLCARP